jgi:D-alanyl-D-alanine carboxypeptidase
LKKGEQLKDISVEKTIDYKNLPYDNKKVGTIKIYYDGELIKEVELAVQEEVRKASFIKVFWEVLKEILLVSK